MDSLSSPPPPSAAAWATRRYELCRLLGGGSAERGLTILLTAERRVELRLGLRARPTPQCAAQPKRAAPQEPTNGSERTRRRREQRMNARKRTDAAPDRRAAPPRLAATTAHPKPPQHHAGGKQAAEPPPSLPANPNKGDLAGDDGIRAGAQNAAPADIMAVCGAEDAEEAAPVLQPMETATEVASAYDPRASVAATKRRLPTMPSGIRVRAADADGVACTAAGRPIPLPLCSPTEPPRPSLPPRVGRGEGKVDVG